MIPGLLREWDEGGTGVLTNSSLVDAQNAG